MLTGHHMYGLASCRLATICMAWSHVAWPPYVWPGLMLPGHHMDGLVSCCHNWSREDPVATLLLWCFRVVRSSNRLSNGTVSFPTTHCISQYISQWIAYMNLTMKQHSINCLSVYLLLYFLFLLSLLKYLVVKIQCPHFRAPQLTSASHITACTTHDWADVSQQRSLVR